MLTLYIQSSYLSLWTPAWKGTLDAIITTIVLFISITKQYFPVSQYPLFRNEVNSFGYTPFRLGGCRTWVSASNLCNPFKRLTNLFSDIAARQQGVPVHETQRDINKRVKSLEVLGKGLKGSGIPLGDQIAVMLD